MNYLSPSCIVDVFCPIKKVSSCCEHSTIIPVPKKDPIPGLNTYRPIMLTSVVMTTFERVLLSHMKGIKLAGHPPAPGLSRDLCRDHVCGPSLSKHHLCPGRQETASGAGEDPQGYKLCPLLFSIHTNDARSRDPTVSVVISLMREDIGVAEKSSPTDMINTTWS